MDSPRSDVLTRWGALKTERASWFAHWLEISQFVLPRSGRFFLQDRNRGYVRNQNIHDNTATKALGVLAAGMMAGMTSPARPWFRLAVPDSDLMEKQDVKLWLENATTMMQRIFNRSNTYRALHQVYLELGAFGTAASIIVPDYENVIHHHPLTAGEYAIATDFQGNVNTLYREFQKQVHEVVGEFGRENCSETVKRLYDKPGGKDQWITLVHAIEPRKEEQREIGKPGAKNMPIRSVYFEIGGDPNKPLRESGFKRFQAVCPRWQVTGGDIYGSSPAMDALGDVMQLQHEQLRKSQGIDYQTKPPLQVPTSYKNSEVNMLPGGINYVDASSPHNGIRSAWDVNLNLQYLLQDIQDVRDRVNKAFYADLFLMLGNMQDTRMTATEVSERHEEKMLMLGPVLERLQNELLDPLVEITFSQMVEANILPPPPQDLQGQDLNVEYVSMLAQAQRAIGTNSVDRFVQSMTMVAQAKPEVLDNFDADEWARDYVDMLGVSAKMLKSQDDVDAMRQQRAQQAAQQQQMEQAQQASMAAKNLASAKTGQSNALTDVTRAFSGYT